MSHKREKALRHDARAEIREMLRSFMSVLRRDIANKITTRRRAEAMTLDEAMPCHTCAFRGATDKWPGFERTCIGLMKALVGGRNFYCHEGFETEDGEFVPPTDLSQMHLCKGFEWLQSEPTFQPQEHFPLPLLLGIAAFKADDSPFGLGHVTQPSPAILAIDDRAGAVFDALASGRITPHEAAAQVDAGKIDPTVAEKMIDLYER